MLREISFKVTLAKSMSFLPSFILSTRLLYFSLSSSSSLPFLAYPFIISFVFCPVTLHQVPLFLAFMLSSPFSALTPHLYFTYVSSLSSYFLSLTSPFLSILSFPLFNLPLFLLPIFSSFSTFLPFLPLPFLSSRRIFPFFFF